MTYLSTLSPSSSIPGAIPSPPKQSQPVEGAPPSAPEWPQEWPSINPFPKNHHYINIPKISKEESEEQVLSRNSPQISQERKDEQDAFRKIDIGCSGFLFLGSLSGFIGGFQFGPEEARLKVILSCSSGFLLSLGILVGTIYSFPEN